MIIVDYYLQIYKILFYDQLFTNRIFNIDDKLTKVKTYVIHIHFNS
jgi:hypothetical protein